MKIGILGNLNSPYKKKYPMYRGDMGVYRWMHEHGHDLVELLPTMSPTKVKKYNDPIKCLEMHDYHAMKWIRLIEDKDYEDEMKSCDAYWVITMPWWGMWERYGFKPVPILEDIAKQNKPIIWRNADDDWMEEARPTYWNKYIVPYYQKFLTAYLHSYYITEEHVKRSGNTLKVVYFPQCYDEFWDEDIKHGYGHEVVFAGPMGYRPYTYDMFKKLLAGNQVTSARLFGIDYAPKYYRLSDKVYEQELYNQFPDKVKLIKDRLFVDHKSFVAEWRDTYLGVHENNAMYYALKWVTPKSPYHTPRLYEALYAGRPVISAPFDDDSDIFTDLQIINDYMMTDPTKLVAKQRLVCKLKWGVDVFAPMVEKLLKGDII